MCKTEKNKQTLDELSRPMLYDELDDTLWNDKCDYVDIEGTINLNPNNYNLAVLQLNIRSILAHQQELKQPLVNLANHNCRIDVVLLCETFLSKNTINMMNIPGYTHIGNYRKDCKVGGVSSYSRMAFHTKEEKTLTFS